MAIGRPDPEGRLTILLRVLDDLGRFRRHVLEGLRELYLALTDRD
jgi:hypothetical protein